MRPLRSLFLAAVIASSALPAHAAPLSVEDAYRMALQNNHQLKAAEEGVRQAEIGVRKAWTYLGPTVNGQISHSWNNEVTAQFPVDNPRAPGLLYQPVNGQCPIPPPQTAFGQPVSGGLACYAKQPTLTDIVVRPAESTTLTLSGSQPVFTGQFLPALFAAQDGRDLARASIKNAREQVLYNVVNLYYQTAAAEKFVRLSDQSYRNLLDHQRSAEAKFAVGQIPRMGLLQAQIEATRAQAALARAQNDYQNAKLAFANLIGAGETPELLSAEELTATTLNVTFPSNVTATALQNRGDLEAAREQVEVARDMRAVNWTAFSPTLFLNGQIQTVDDPGAFGEKDSWTVMLMLNVPLIQGGRRVFDLQEGYSKVRQAESQLAAKKDEVQLDVQTALSRLEVTRQNLAVAEQQRNLARENYQITKVSFDNGLATSLDMIDANQTLLGAELNATREQLNVRLETLNVLRSTGMLASTLNVPVEED